MEKIPLPTKDQVQHYSSTALKEEEYSLNDKALKHLYHNIYPENNDLLEIKVKVSTLNDFYSTNIYRTHLVSKRILDLNIDERLRQKDETLVNDIARVNINGKTFNFYSFATKYCSHHKPDDYPIYDRYVDEMLWHFQKTKNFSNFKRPELRDYPKFKKIIYDFIRFFDLEEFSIKDIDRYLWAGGTKYFSKKRNN